MVHLRTVTSPTLRQSLSNVLSVFLRTPKDPFLARKSGNIAWVIAIVTSPILARTAIARRLFVIPRTGRSDTAFDETGTHERTSRNNGAAYIMLDKFRGQKIFSSMRANHGLFCQWSHLHRWRP